MQLEFLGILGSDNQPLPHSFVRQDGETSHLAIFLPGYAYGPDRPALHYPVRLLTELGADALILKKIYASVPGFASLPENERIRMIVADALSACTAGLARREYSRITLVGKSLGTIAMARLLKLLPELQDAECIWLTPILQHERSRAIILEKKPRSLFVIGTADQYYDPEILQELEQGTNGRSLVLPDAHHGLEVADSTRRSIAHMDTMIASIQDFLAE